MASQEEIARYQELRRQGYSGQQASEMVWGPGGIAGRNEQDRKAAARSAQLGKYGQIAGTIGGLYGAKRGYEYLFPTKEAAAEAARGAGSMTSAIPTTSPVTSTIPYSTPQAGAVGGMSVQPRGTSFAENFRLSNATAPEGLTAIQSNADGSVKYVPTESLGDTGFMSSVNWGNVAQGVVGGLQVIQAYNAYKGGDKLGAGIYGAAGLGSLAASGVAGAALEAGAEQALGGSLIPGLNIVAGAYGGYKTAEALSDMPGGSQRTKAGVMGGAASGAAIGSIFGPPGTAIGAAIGAVAGAIGSWTGSHKGKAQFMRDNIRKVMQEGQILDKDFKGTLADGSTYDFGKDGSTMKWKEIDKVAAANPNSWSAAVPLTDALAASYGFVGQKASDISAWYAKAAVSNAGDDPAKARANVQHFAMQQGLSLDSVKQKLDEAIADSRITQPQYDAYMNGATQLFAGMPAPSGAPGQQVGSVRIERPEKGKVGRVSAGLYRTDTGKLQAAPTMRQALERAYRKGNNGGTATVSKKG